MASSEHSAPAHFIRAIIEADLESKKYDGRVVTRFPPHPNGYLHIGHAKAICINYGLADQYGGTYHLRFDDTNPSRESIEYVEAIQRDIRWLGFDWGKHLYYASDYFDQLYEWACKLVRDGKAYVCDLSGDEVREHRGTLTEPGRNSPFRDRSVAENLDLLERMRAGEFADGSRTLRAKIDMAAPNLNLRDPVMYRIQRTTHHRTGDRWCIYPTYDWSHGQSDSIERITHSICTLEFEDHRPLYDWFLEALDLYRPQQIEFGKLGLTHTLLGKRHIRALVEEGHVSGWDDPRMPTVSGLRRRGYTPESIRDFMDRTGVAKREGANEIELLEHCLREDLNRRAPRVMAVLRPLKVVIENYPQGQVEEFEAVNNPEDETMGTRMVPFSRELFIEREDFMEDAPRKFFRLAPGREVRLRYAYFITCTDVIKDASGEVVELRCSYDPKTRGGDAPDGRKVKGTLHWVSAAHAARASVRLYDRMFSSENPGDSADFRDDINAHSLEQLEHCPVEPSLRHAAVGTTYQFERQGYFCVDSVDSSPDALVFNRAVSLRDSWAKIQKNDPRSEA